MSECPKCSAPVPETAFGLYSCDQCKAVLSVDMSGHVSLGETPVELSESEPTSEFENKPENLEPLESPATTEEEPYTLDVAPGVSSEPNLSEVVEFANSTTASASYGLYLYDVLIGGLDSDDLRSVLRESLTDRRFGWKAQDLMSKIKAGTLLIEGLNSAKATVLINRLKSHSLEISWVQNGILEQDTL